MTVTPVQNLESSDERKWRSFVRRCTWRINFGWWLTGFLPSLVAGGVLWCGGVVGLKRIGITVDSTTVVATFGTVLLAVAAVGYFVRRRLFYGADDVLVRLDCKLGLHNRLLCAHKQIGPWPKFSDSVGDSLQWQGRRIVAPILICIAAFGIGIGMPTAISEVPESFAIEEPASWMMVESWIDILDESETIEETDLQELRNKLESMRDQPEQKWYEHGSLEAGDHLQEQFQSSIESMQSELETAREALMSLDEIRQRMKEFRDSEALAESRSANSADLKKEFEELNKALQEAIRNLEMGDLGLDKKLLEQLRQISPSQFDELSQEQLEALIQSLKKGISGCKRCTSMCKTSNGSVTGFGLAGPSGIARGPGEAPLAVHTNRTELGTETVEATNQADLKNVALGDMVGLAQIEYDIDTTRYAGPTKGGSIHSQGEGGKVVWKEHLPPAENEVLKRYFQ